MDRVENLVVAEDLQMVFRIGKMEVPALRGINLKVRTGEFLAIMGPSGCGKSTLLHLLGGLLTPSSGRIWIDGVEMSLVSDAERTEIRKLKIGFVFQRFNLLPTLTARHNIELACRIHGNGNQNEARTREIFRLLGLEGKMDHKPSELSGGEQQRISVARAVINRPALLLADEPTGNLDSQNSENVLSILKELNLRYNQTILMITHNPDAAAAASRIIRMKDGRLVNPDSELNDVDVGRQLQLESGSRQIQVQADVLEPDQQVVARGLHQLLLNGNPETAVDPEHDSGEKGGDLVGPGGQFERVGLPAANHLRTQPPYGVGLAESLLPGGEAQQQELRSILSRPQIVPVGLLEKRLIEDPFSVIDQERAHARLRDVSPQTDRLVLPEEMKFPPLLLVELLQNVGPFLLDDPGAHGSEISASPAHVLQNRLQTGRCRNRLHGRQRKIREASEKQKEEGDP